MSTKVNSTTSGSQCPFMKRVRGLKEGWKSAILRVAREFECAATKREMMRKLGPDQWCKLEQCDASKSFDPLKHKRCVEWVEEYLSLRNGPID